ncbi:hypothetical protein [Azonexus hydrophilus]
MAQNLKVLGFDDNSCKAWRSSGDRTCMVAWARGFSAGTARSAPARRRCRRRTVERNIEQYCRKNPAGLFIDAAYRMSDSMSGRNEPIRK